MTSPRESLVVRHVEVDLPNNREEFIDIPCKVGAKSIIFFCEFNAVEPVRTKTPQSGSRRRYEIAKTTLALSITATVVITIVPKTLLRRENLSFWLYVFRYLRFQRFPRSFAPSPHLAEEVKRIKQSF